MTMSSVCLPPIARPDPGVRRRAAPTWRYHPSVTTLMASPGRTARAIFRSNVTSTPSCRAARLRRCQSVTCLCPARPVVSTFASARLESSTRNPARESARIPPTTASAFSGVTGCPVTAGFSSMRTTPHASPLLASDLAGLPPAVVVTGEYDVLPAEGDAYATRLAAAGVEVVHQVTPGADHYFLDGDRSQTHQTLDLIA